MLIQQIDPTIIVAIIGVAGGVLPVGITYVLTKRKEINVTIREEKTKRYDDLISALAMIVRSKPDDDEPLDNFITAYHRAMAFANDLVLERCNQFAQWFYKQWLSKQLEQQQGVDLIERNRRIREIYAAIRLDINPKAKYSEVFSLGSFKKEKATE